jgi:hypothetical protein
MLALLATTSACGGSTSDGPPGWKRHADEGVEVWLPDGFEEEDWSSREAD